MRDRQEGGTGDVPVKHASLEVMEERVSGLSARVGDLVDTLKSVNHKIDKVIALEVKQTELHHDVREAIKKVEVVASDVNQMSHRVTSEVNGLGGRVGVVEATLETHKRNFRLVAGFVSGTFVVGLAVMGWLFNRVYDGVLAAIHAAGP